MRKEDLVSPASRFSDPNDLTPEDITPEDPRLTAYALGELQGDERTQFEALLQKDPAAQQEVDDLRALGSSLEAELGGVSDGQLDLAARNELLRVAQTPDAPSGAWHVVRLAAVACLLVGLIVWAVVSSIPSIDVRTRGERMAHAPGPDTHVRAPGDARAGLVNAARPEPAPSDLRIHSEQGPSKPVGEANTGELGLTPKGGRSDTWEYRVRPGDTVTSIGGTRARPTAVGLRAGGMGVAGAGSGANRNTLDEVAARELGSFKVRWYRERAPGSAPASKKVQPGMREPSDPVFGLPAGRQPAGLKMPPVDLPGGVPPGVVLRGLSGYGSPGFVAPGRVAPGTVRYGDETYQHPGIDPFHRVTKKDGHTSTFSVDVDTASYSNIRRMLRSGQLPPPAAVRLEEFVNYFDYGYAAPDADSEAPFRTHVEVATCPWNPAHRLARIAIKGRTLGEEQRPAANLVFLVDVSGSMQGEDKLPLVKAGLERLVESIRADDRVAIVTYAATAALRLSSTPGSERETILAAIRALKAGGSTNGAGGIQMAYAEAKRGFRKEGVNRVLLCTDGDFNVGVSDDAGLVRLIAEQAKSGVYLSVLGYGTGNFQDGKMEALSNNGNGNYAYIDSQLEAERVLVQEMEGTLVTIAKDVKFQLWFNPATVSGWRLLGYENRRLAARDFNDDSKDAGEIGAGHEVTALYEIIPTGALVPGTVDANPFVSGGVKAATGDAAAEKDAPLPADKALFIWRLRWKAPEGGASSLIERNVFDKGLTFEKADRDFQWASAVGAFGMLLRRSPHRQQASFELVLELAAPAAASERRKEFLELVKRAQGLLRGR